jgi:hypothetical protein
MTYVDDRIQVEEDTIAEIISLLLAEPNISSFVDDRLLEEDMNTLHDYEYPYGEVISVNKDHGGKETNTFLIVDHGFIIQWYTDKMDVEGKVEMKKLAAATEAVLEKNFQHTPWFDTTWKGTRLSGFVTNDDGEAIERYAQIHFDFKIQIRRN